MRAVFVVSTASGPVAAYVQHADARKYAASLKAAGVAIVKVSRCSLFGDWSKGGGD